MLFISFFFNIASSVSLMKSAETSMLRKLKRLWNHKQHLNTYDSFEQSSICQNPVAADHGASSGIFILCDSLEYRMDK